MITFSNPVNVTRSSLRDISEMRKREENENCYQVVEIRVIYLLKYCVNLWYDRVEMRINEEMTKNVVLNVGNHEKSDERKFDFVTKSFLFISSDVVTCEFAQGWIFPSRLQSQNSINIFE